MSHERRTSNGGRSTFARGNNFRFQNKGPLLKKSDIQCNLVLKYWINKYVRILCRAQCGYLIYCTFIKTDFIQHVLRDLHFLYIDILKTVKF